MSSFSSRHPTFSSLSLLLIISHLELTLNLSQMQLWTLLFHLNKKWPNAILIQNKTELLRSICNLAQEICLFVLDNLGRDNLLAWFFSYKNVSNTKQSGNSQMSKQRAILWRSMTGVWYGEMENHESFDAILKATDMNKTEKRGSLHMFVFINYSNKQNIFFCVSQRQSLIWNEKKGE